MRVLDGYTLWNCWIKCTLDDKRLEQRMTTCGALAATSWIKHAIALICSGSIIYFLRNIFFNLGL